MKPLKIAKSTLTNPPRYYAFRNYKLRGEGTLVVTGSKEDITEQIEELLGSGQGGWVAVRRAAFDEAINEVMSGRTINNFGHVPEVRRALEWVWMDLQGLRDKEPSPPASEAAQEEK